MKYRINAPDMDCPDCDHPLVTFRVPPALREYAPVDEVSGSESTGAGICPRCYRTVGVDADEADRSPPKDVDFSTIDESFPHGEAGVALALVLGKLDSLALNRTAIADLLAVVEREGTDGYLALDRLDREGAHVDLDRRLAQLDDFV